MESMPTCLGRLIGCGTLLLLAVVAAALPLIMIVTKTFH
jgi:hypothetical protein